MYEDLTAEEMAAAAMEDVSLIKEKRMELQKVALVQTEAGKDSF